jgi:transposase
MTKDTIGVDISKDSLDAFRYSNGASRRFSNTKQGHKAFIAWIGGPVERVVFEPTGPYHRAFEHALALAGLPMVKVNPRQARRFAEATGALAKTDRLDAALLARMGVALTPQARPAPSATIVTLRQLQGAREALVRDRTALKNRQKILDVPVLVRQNAETLDRIKTQLEEIEQEIERLIQADPVLARRFEILTSIPGIAAVTARKLLIEMPELGAMSGKQAASLAGLAPVTRQSGRWTGRARIRGGRAQIRVGIYMAGMVACRFNPDLKKSYEALMAAGKPPKLAITAIMRKLLVLANALLSQDRLWAKDHPAKA